MENTAAEYVQGIPDIADNVVRDWLTPIQKNKFMDRLYRTNLHIFPLCSTREKDLKPTQTVGEEGQTTELSSEPRLRK